MLSFDLHAFGWRFTRTALSCTPHFFHSHSQLGELRAPVGSLQNTFMGKKSKDIGRPLMFSAFFFVRVMLAFTLAQFETAFAQLEDRGRTIFAFADGLSNAYLIVFDGVHTYNPVGIARDEVAAQYASMSLLARAQGRLFAATIIPGYDEAYKASYLTYLDREGGETYRQYWALARASAPHSILITSFNEWHEGSEIEPSVEFGTTYLEITAEQAAAWKRGDPVSEGTSADRDGDGVPDEQDYCPDFPGDAATNGC